MKRALAIDFGTEEFRVAVPGEGIVLRQPSCVAVEVRTEKVAYIGKEALYKAKTDPDHYRLCHPFQDNWIFGERVAPVATDFMARALGQVYGEAEDVRLLLSIPCGLSDEEEYAAQELGHCAGFAETYLV